MKYNKAHLWNGKDLKGAYEFSYKIDGVRMLRDEDGKPVSRSGKPLYNLEDVPAYIVDAEIFLKDWETSVSMVRTKYTDEKVPVEYVYELDRIDPRLDLYTIMDPCVEFIEEALNDAVSEGYEGLILRNVETNRWLKVKPSDNYDVEVIGTTEGTGKYEGKLGALVTNMGKVGTGLTDEDRSKPIDSWIGKTIEVECMGLTKNGKFRHPRYVRDRWDK